VIRLLRRYGAANIGRRLASDRAGSALFTLLLIGVLVLEFGSLGMLRLEHSQPGANITTAADALWYTIVTMSTVGYGDAYPVGTPGRALRVSIIVVGVGIFGTLTGWLANFFLTPHRAQPESSVPPTLHEAQQRIDQLSELIEQQRAALANSRPCYASAVDRAGSEVNRWRTDA
jgi:voltage-gated potassium channel